jgi:hypothetical protein
MVEYGTAEPQHAQDVQGQAHPTPEQERVLDRTRMLYRHVYNAAVEERREAWRMCGVSVGYYQQKAELPLMKAEMPEYGEVARRAAFAVARRCNSWLVRT